ncbi:pilus assembly protein FimT [Pseudomonas sp. RW407]|uniref:pilus assembly FimT family protein n=1 Tax=Pseudomonas sp. RW407 TaxID=2202894 RepID=UPI000D6F7728|nr:GspH/FimT family pseudopilin [Pseudomonas sp. RW407]PWU29592.1 pilus assembly protein FimT [Pseudomonas sp. RW407]
MSVSVHPRRLVPMEGAGGQRAFTLIELMVVVALVAIFASIAVPAFGSLIESSRVKSSASALYRLFQGARADAVSTRTAMSLCQNGSAYEWLLVRAGSCASLDASLVAQRLSLPSSIGVTSSVSGLTFRADGSAAVASLSLSGSKSGSSYSIKVAASGYMSLGSGSSQ